MSPQQTSLFAGDCSTTNATIYALWRTLEMGCDYGEVLKNNAADGIKVDEPNAEVLPCLSETCLTAKNTKMQHVYP